MLTTDATSAIFVQIFDRQSVLLATGRLIKEDRMQGNSLFRIGITCLTVFCFNLPLNSVVRAQENSDKNTVEPVFRVPNLKSANETPDQPAADESATAAANGALDSNSNSDRNEGERVADARAGESAASSAVEKRAVEVAPSRDLAKADATIHPLDRAINIAKDGLVNMRENIHDYTAILVKRERINGQLSEPAYMKVKIRNPREINGQSIPFSIYMKFIKPKAVAGREVIWVEGQNQDKLIAHEPGRIRGFKNFHLDPTGFLAMQDNRYPIYDAGLENLVIKLIEKAERDRAAGVCQVRYLDGAEINKRPCQLIEVVHERKAEPFEFHKAKVYVDEEMFIPVRYVAYDWPGADGKPKILEEYTYINVALNVGLCDDDFCIRNSRYNFAR